MILRLLNHPIKHLLPTEKCLTSNSSNSRDVLTRCRHFAEPEAFPYLRVSPRTLLENHLLEKLKISVKLDWSRGEIKGDKPTLLGAWPLRQPWTLWDGMRDAREDGKHVLQPRAFASIILNPEIILTAACDTTWEK